MPIPLWFLLWSDGIFGPIHMEIQSPPCAQNLASIEHWFFFIRYIMILWIWITKYCFSPQSYFIYVSTLPFASLKKTLATSRIRIPAHFVSMLLAFPAIQQYLLILMRGIDFRRLAVDCNYYCLFHKHKLKLTRFQFICIFCAAKSLWEARNGGLFSTMPQDLCASATGQPYTNLLLFTISRCFINQFILPFSFAQLTKLTCSSL